MNTETQTSNELVRLVETSGLEKSKAQVLLDNFTNYFEIAAEWEVKLNALNVTDVSQKAEMKMAGEARKLLKQKRIAVENTRKELKEQSLREGQTIDSIARVLKNLIEPLEERAEKIERFAELKEAEEKAERLSQRLTLLAPYNVAVDSGLIKEMTAEMFDSYLLGVVKAHEEAKAAAQKAEEERAERERVNALHRSRKDSIIHLWNFWPNELKDENFGEVSEEHWSRLVSEAEARKFDYDKEQERIKAENERLRIEAETARAKAEAGRKAAEAEAARVKAEQEAQLKKEREERERIEAELKAKKDAEEKARLEAEAKAEAELSKGDKEKFDDLLTELSNLNTKYTFKSKKYRELYKSVQELINKTVNYAISKQ